MQVLILIHTSVSNVRKLATRATCSAVTATRSISRGRRLISKNFFAPRFSTKSRRDKARRSRLIEISRSRSLQGKSGERDGRNLVKMAATPRQHVKFRALTRASSNMVTQLLLFVRSIAVFINSTKFYLFTQASRLVFIFFRARCSRSAQGIFIFRSKQPSTTRSPRSQVVSARRYRSRFGSNGTIAAQQKHEKGGGFHDIRRRSL